MAATPLSVNVTSSGGQRRAVSYVRVSTGKQVDRSVSMKAQLREISDYAAANGLQLLKNFRDEGRTGRNARRAGLQALMDFALSPGCSVDVVIIYSYLRFMRRLRILEDYIEKLEDAGIEVVAVKQPLPPGPEGRLLRRQFASLDEYDSEIKGQNTLACMLENARQGFWNGSTPPFGYEARVVETRGDRQKKKLFPDPITAPTVQRIFQLYLHGDGSTGPLGCLALSRFLDAEGTTYRRGAEFTAKAVNDILNNRAYIGELNFNVTDSKSGTEKPETAWITVKVDPIIEKEVFSAAQRRLGERNPRKNGMHPRTASSPLLLADLVICFECGQTMVKSSGKGYEYYSCRSKASRSGCSGHAASKPELERLVVDAVHERAFAPSRLQAIGDAIAKAVLCREGSDRQALDGARLELKSIDKELQKLMDPGVLGIFASAMDQLKQKVDDLATQRLGVKKRIGELEKRMALARKRIPKAKLLNFADAFRTVIESSPAAAVRTWLAAHVERVFIDGERVEIAWR